MVQGIEKREFERIKTPNLVIDYKINDSESIYQAEVVNLSAGGLLFLRNTFLVKNDQVLIKFPFKHKKILITGIVLRLDGREVGIHFTSSEAEVEKFVELFNQEYPQYKREISRKNKDALFDEAHEKRKHSKKDDDMLDID